MTDATTAQTGTNEDEPNWFEQRSTEIERHLSLRQTGGMHADYVYLVGTPLRNALIAELQLCYQNYECAQLYRRNELMEAQLHLELAISKLPFREEFHNHAVIDEDGAHDELHVSVNAVMNRAVLHMAIVKDLLGIEIPQVQDDQADVTD